MSANWSLWADVPHTELWRAVALSMDIEPVDLPGFDRSSIRDPIFNYPFHHCPEEFRRRLEIARKHLGHKLMPISFSHSDWKSEVSLLEMRKWAAALNNPWDFPEQFPGNKAILDQASELNKLSQPNLTREDKQNSSSDPAVPALVKTNSHQLESRGWFAVHGDYVVGLQIVNKYSSAKTLYAALETAARAGSGPFDIGEGDQRGSLVAKLSRRSVSYKSIANRWSLIRKLAAHMPSPSPDSQIP